MKEETFLKSTLAKQLDQFAKLFRTIPNQPTKTQFETMRLQSNRFYYLLTFLENCFPEHVYAEANSMFRDLSERLDETRKEEAVLVLLGRFSGSHKSSDPKKSKTKSSKKLLRKTSEQELDGIIREFYNAHDELIGRTVKHLKRISDLKIAKALLHDFNFVDHLSFSVWMKTLDKKREQLFNQIVKIIRTSQKEDLMDLMIQAEEFGYFLEMMIQAGYEKGKRLLQIIRSLSDRLVEVDDEENFRQRLENLEKERAKDPNRISDIQRLRMIRIRLGIFQANTRKALHAHLPVSLQVLKRRLVWS